MAVEKGSAFLLKIGNGGCAGGLCDDRGAAHDADLGERRGGQYHQQGSGGWRQLLPGAGVRAVSVSGARHLHRSAAEVRLRDHALGGAIDDYELSFERREAARQVPGDAARLCRGLQWRARPTRSAWKARARWRRCERGATSCAGRRALRSADRTLIVRPSFAAWSQRKASWGRCWRWPTGRREGPADAGRDGGVDLALPWPSGTG